jgi:hypothetical protein
MMLQSSLLPFHTVYALVCVMDAGTLSVLFIVTSWVEADVKLNTPQALVIILDYF